MTGKKGMMLTVVLRQSPERNGRLSTMVPSEGFTLENKQLFSYVSEPRKTVNEFGDTLS